MTSEVTLALIGVGSPVLTLVLREGIAALVQRSRRRDKVREVDVWLSEILEPYIRKHGVAIEVLGERHHVLVPWIGVLIHAVDELGYRHWNGDRISVDDLNKQLSAIPERPKDQGFLLDDLRRVVRRMRGGDSKPPKSPTQE